MNNFWKTTLLFWALTVCPSGEQAKPTSPEILLGKSKYKESHRNVMHQSNLLAMEYPERIISHNSLF